MSFRPIVGIPRLTQDWGTEQHERETHWTSLFYDLMIVAALNAIAEPFEEFEENDEEEEGGIPQLVTIRLLWLDALLQFASVVNSWNALNEITSYFEDETFFGHISFFVHCCGLAATTAGCVGELKENYLVLGTGIVMAKVGLLVLYARPVLFIPRARYQALLRCFSFVISTIIILVGMSFDGEDAFERFRVTLLLMTVWDWVCLFLQMLLKKEQRIPIHIQSYSDRIKEGTMIIFGEAIFAIILQPHSGALPHTHFYVALATTLWLIYSMALQEFHITPSEDDHALRRSIFFGYSWYYTQFVKQFALLGASIGIKRAHLLTFKFPDEPIDTDTRRLIVWGLSFTLFSIVLIRTYSFGWGRHPSSKDPPTLYWMKTGWWVIIGAASLLPQLLDYTVIEAHPQPLAVLAICGAMMALIILMEAIISNLVAAEATKLVAKKTGGEHHPNELTYINHLAHDDDVPEPFLAAHGPKTS